jgi:hypothetical protein
MPKEMSKEIASHLPSRLRVARILLDFGPLTGIAGELRRGLL